jgi:hypothetical protein
VIKTTIIITNHKIQAIFISSLSNEFSTKVQLNFKTKIIYGFSLYCSPLQQVEYELNHIKNSIDLLKPQFSIISMDSNAKSKLWFSKSDDRRGELITEFISEMNFILLNDNEITPTFFTTRGESFIDLTLISENLTNAIKNWEVLETNSMSDHRYIVFDINEKTEEINYKNTRKYIITTDSCSPLLF